MPAKLLLLLAVAVSLAYPPQAPANDGKPVILRSTGPPGTITWVTEPRQAAAKCHLGQIAAVDTPGAEQPAEAVVVMIWDGHPKVVVWVIGAAGSPIVITKDRYEIPADGDTPTPPVGVPDQLAVYVADLADGLDLNPPDRGKVAGMFALVIPQIRSSKLRGSKAIVESVTKPIADLKSVKWQSFSTLLYQHLLRERKLISQEQWAEAYESIVVGLGGRLQAQAARRCGKCGNPIPESTVTLQSGDLEYCLGCFKDIVALSRTVEAMRELIGGVK